LKDLKVLSLPVERFGQVAEPRVRAVAAPEAMTRLAELLVALGDPKRATDLLERALVLDPQQPRTRALLGRALGASERHPEAEAMFAKAVEQEPDSALTHVDYGLYLTSRAIQRDANTVRIQPTDLPAEQRADYLKRGRAEYERAIALDGSLPEAHTELAFTYLAPGEPAAEAIPHADRAFDLLPSNSTVALQLAEVLIASGKLDEARPLLTRLLPQASASRKYKAYLDELMARVAQGQSAAQ
jgi:tetratricopeptide (TPR) repeat protein